MVRVSFRLSHLNCVVQQYKRGIVSRCLNYDGASHGICVVSIPYQSYLIYRVKRRFRRKCQSHTLFLTFPLSIPIPERRNFIYCPSSSILLSFTRCFRRFKLTFARPVLHNQQQNTNIQKNM